MFVRWFSLCWLVALSAACSRRDAREGSGRLPPRVPPPSAAELDDTFSYLGETFADVRILRYRVPSFEGLSLTQKTLLYYLQEAALSGRDITYDQHYEHNLRVRRTLEALITHADERQSHEYEALLVYLKRIWLSNGIHHHESHRKFLPEGISPEAFAARVKKVPKKALPLDPGEDVDAFLARIVPIIFDPRVSPRNVNKRSDEDTVATSANHFYVNLTADQVRAYTEEARAKDGGAPRSLGLNSQLVGKGGHVEERPWRVSGMYGAALTECVRWLEKAQAIAENEAQQRALNALIAFYRSGNPGDFDRYSIAWVEDDASRIDLIHGFIETYGDPLGLRGTYEALVELTDEQATLRMRTLSQHATWFEEHSPIAPEFKKERIVGVHARVVEAVVAAGDTAPVMPIGVNLPNAPWIREQYGSKSVTLGNILAAYEAERRDNGVLQEFSVGPREVARARAYAAQAHALLVDMHEVIGHASGRRKDGVGDVNETLGHYGSTLEEARAELFALYYLLDPELIQLKLLSSLEVSRAGYDAFLRGALLQLASVPLGETLEEDHMRSRQLIVQWVFEQDPEGAVVERLERDDKTFYVVRDYPKLRALFGQLLREVQRIKSEGDLPAARALVESYGVRVDPRLHAEIRTRYGALKVPPYAGFLQPELSLVKKADQIVDVRIDYPTDFATQQLRYSAKYSFLPPTN